MPLLNKLSFVGFDCGEDAKKIQTPSKEYSYAKLNQKKYNECAVHYLLRNYMPG